MLMRGDALKKLQEEIRSLRKARAPTENRPRKSGVGRTVQTSPGLIPLPPSARGSDSLNCGSTNVQLANYTKMIQEMDRKIAGMALSLEDLRKGVLWAQFSCFGSAGPR